MRTVLIVTLALGCGDDFHRTPIADARIDTNDSRVIDADLSPGLFGESCPIASGGLTVYYCHNNRGQCVAEADGNHCRPTCGNRTEAYCAQLGGHLFIVGTPPVLAACVCVP